MTTSSNKFDAKYKLQNGYYLLEYGVPGPIRTADLSLRRRLLYPAELRGLIHVSIPMIFTTVNE